MADTKNLTLLIGLLGDTRPVDADANTMLQFRKALRDAYGHDASNQNQREYFNKACAMDHSSWQAIADSYAKLVENDAPIDLTSITEELDTFLQSSDFKGIPTKEARQKRFCEFAKDHVYSLIEDAPKRDKLMDYVIGHYESKFKTSLKHFYNNTNDVIEECCDTPDNQIDVVKLSVPLFIRLLEWAREDAESDEAIHAMVERLLNLEGRVVSMAEYDTVVPPQHLSPSQIKMAKLAGIEVNTREM